MLAEALAAGDTISEPNEAIKGADVVEDVIEVGGIEEDKRLNSGKEDLGVIHNVRLKDPENIKIYLISI